MKEVRKTDAHRLLNTAFTLTFDYFIISSFFRHVVDKGEFDPTSILQFFAERLLQSVTRVLRANDGFDVQLCFF